MKAAAYICPSDTQCSPESQPEPQKSITRTFLGRRQPRLAGFRTDHVWRNAGEPSPLVTVPGRADALVWAAWPLPDASSYVLLDVKSTPEIYEIDFDPDHLAAMEIYFLALCEYNFEQYRGVDYLYGWVNEWTSSRSYGKSVDTCRVGIGNTDPDYYQGTYAHEMGHLFASMGDTGHHEIDMVGWDVLARLAEGMFPGYCWPHVRASGKAGPACGDPLFDIAGSPPHITWLRWVDRNHYDRTLSSGAYESWLDMHFVEPVPADPPPLPIDFLFIPITMPDDPGLHGEIHPVFERSNYLLSTVLAPSTLGRGSVLIRDTMGSTLYETAFQISESDSTLAGIAAPADPSAHSIELYRDSVLQDAITRTANAPVVTVASPQPGDVLDSSTLISWSASDADGDVLLGSVEYSSDGVSNWTPLALRTDETTVQLVPDRLPAGTAGAIRVRVSDGFNTTAEEVSPLTLGPNRLPEVHIASPQHGDTFLESVNIVFSASIYDPEDFFLTGNRPGAEIKWISDLDGDLGLGTALNVATLSVGVHVITLQVTDTAAGVSTDSITIQIESP